MKLRNCTKWGKFWNPVDFFPDMFFFFFFGGGGGGAKSKKNTKIGWRIHSTEVTFFRLGPKN